MTNHRCVVSAGVLRRAKGDSVRRSCSANSSIAGTPVRRMDGGWAQPAHVRDQRLTLRTLTACVVFVEHTNIRMTTQ